MNVFPVGLVLEGRQALVIGCEPEAAARAHDLLEAGARVVALSVEPPPELIALHDEGRLVLERRRAGLHDFAAARLAVYVDRDARTALELAAWAEASKTWFCAVDQPAALSFAHLARVRAGSLTIAISTAGRAPALASRLRQELQRLCDAAGVAAFVERLSALREVTPSAERRAVLGQAVAGLHFEGQLVLPEATASDQSNSG